MSFFQSLAPALGDLGGSIISGLFNAKEADENRSWQAAQRKTAYQVAARDLEAAGLNRVLALGSPASVPSGSTGSMPSSSPGSTYIAASSAKAQIAKAAQEVDLIKETEEKTKQDKSTGAAVEANNKANTQATLELIPYQKASAVASAARDRATAARENAQKLLTDEQARLARLEAAKQQVVKSGYEAGAPLIKKGVEFLQNSAKTIFEKSKNLNNPNSPRARARSNSSAPFFFPKG